MIAYVGKAIIRYLQNHKKDKIESYGDKNPDKIFYVIHPEGDEKVGLFAYVTIVLGHIRYARKKGYIPIVDMKNYPNTYLATNKMFIDNAWEYYFEQPDKYTLEEVYSSKNVILSTGAPYCWPDASTGFCFNKSLRNYWKKIVLDSIAVKENILEEVKHQKDLLFGKDEKILAVKCRGTDYLKLKPKWHPRQPEPEMVIEKAREILNQKKCNRIFLSTEDKSILELFQKEFGELVITNEQVRYDYEGDGYISALKSDREDDAYLQGYEYLITTLLLAECDCFIGGRNGGTVAALLFSKNYDYQYIWNLGRYK